MTTLLLKRVCAQIVPVTDQTIQEAAQRILAGRLVAFPTETVYGLGANGLDEQAVLRIFEAKGRPLTDPVIAHVLGLDDALPLVAFDQDDSGTGRREHQIFRDFTDRFWPGPITFVCKANMHKVSPKITASTGWVGLRAPSHAVSRRLIAACGVPICAPSANRFGHVSPTTAQHVFDDLKYEDVLILDGGRTDVGIESTILKLDTDRGRVVMLRRGGIAESEILEFMASCSSVQGMEFVVVDRSVSMTSKESQVAPGQLITHYAPDIPAYLTTISSTKRTPQDPVECIASLKETVVLDFWGLLVPLEPHCYAYRNLSSRGDAKEAAKSLFEYLRWSEQINDGPRCQDGQSAPSHDLVPSGPVRAVLIADVRPLLTENERLRAVFDRMFRACSGRSAVANGLHVFPDSSSS